MTNEEVLVFTKGLMDLRPELTGRVFTHAVVLNQKRVKDYSEALHDAKKPDKDMLTYLNAYEELKKKHALKDDNGVLIVDTKKNPATGILESYYTIPDSDDPHSKFSIASQELFEQHKSAIDNHNKMLLEWQEKLLNEKSPFIPYMIKEEDIPDQINIYERRGIAYMISNGEE